MNTDSITYLENLHEEPNLSIWTVKIHANRDSSVKNRILPKQLAPGLYTLAISHDSQQIPSHQIKKLCGLPPLPGVATVLAVTRDERQSSGTETGTYYWYEPVEAGSLESLVQARGTLPLAEVATLAHHIGWGLKSLHAAHIYPEHLAPKHVMVTVAGLPEFLCLPSSVKASKRQPDEHEHVGVHDFVALLWYALTGESPRQTHQRIPLPLLADVPQTLGTELERLLDDPKATAQEVLDAFSAFQTQPLNAYTSAPESVRSKLPVASREPNTVKSTKTLPKVRHQNAQKLIGKSTFKVGHSRGRSKARNFTTRKLVILGVGSLIILGAGAIVGATWVPEAMHHHESHATQPAVVSTPQDEQAILTQVIEERNQSLSSQGAATLKLRSLTRILHRDSDSLGITAEVESPGYTPTDAEQKESGVHLVDGVPVQTVIFELHCDEGVWRIVTATPVTAETPNEPDAQPTVVREP